MRMLRINIIVFYFGLFLLSANFVDAVTEDDVKECGSYIFGRVLCTSVRTFYRECIVPGANSIDLIKLHQNFTKEPCVFKDTFGFRGNAVWVNLGCSGEFYVCYEGERVSTDYPVLTVTVSPPAGKTTPDPDVASGSTIAGSDDVLLYIIIVIAVVVVVGIGLVIGCYVKRRQHRDRSKRLAEKRQAKIEQRAYRNQVEENDINTLPVATRSLSMESVRAGSSAKDNSNTYVSYEREGSVCSSKSSMSDFTSVSAQTIGGTDNFHPTQSANSLERSRKNNSLTDIRSVGRIYSEVMPVTRQSIRTDRSSLSSLESIREVCNKYQMVDIPIERRYKKKSESRNKYNTVGYSESRAGSRSVNSAKIGTMTLPLNRKKTRAVVHVSPPHIPNEKTSVKSSSNFEKPVEQHYHDPDALGIPRDGTEDKVTDNSTVDNEHNALSTEADEVYAVVSKHADVVEAVDNIPIYATVTKSCLKSQRQSESPNGGCSVTFKDSEETSKESNYNIYSLYGKPFTYLSSFRPIEIDMPNKPSKELALDLKATTC